MLPAARMLMIGEVDAVIAILFIISKYLKKKEGSL